MAVGEGGVPLEPSPSTDDGDYNGEDEGMEIRLGFSPQVKLWSEPASTSSNSGADVPVPRAVASLSEA